MGKFRRLLRCSNYLLVVECNLNSAGWFLKIMKIQNGVVRNIVVPVEFEVGEWVKFENCLKCFYLKFSKKSSVDGSVEGRNVKDQRQTSIKQCGIEVSKAPTQRPIVKLPSLSVVILRHRSSFS